MTRWRRRIRAAIGMGLTWGAAWFGAGMGILLVVGPDAADVPFPLGFGALGFLAGATFSIVLGLVESGRRFEQMSVPRFAGWGAVGGVVLSGIVAGVTALGGDATLLRNLVVLVPVFGLAGAGSAAGSLVLARMAEEGAALEAGDDAAEIGRGGEGGTRLPGGRAD